MQSAPGTMGLGVVAFLGLWLAMMAAMMLPALAPLGVMLAGERRGPVRAARAASIGGYLAAWAAFGVLALALSIAAKIWPTATSPQPPGRRLPSSSAPASTS